ncbi:MAG: hypothetical protein U9O24_05135 [Campylobacterota bacterium]|nr:hypothetical protein [Campylobacterota bacterium]
MKKLIVILLLVTNLFGEKCTFQIKNQKDLDLIQTVNCKSLNIDFYEGKYILNSPISLQLKKTDGVVIRGKGIRNTKLIVANTKGAIDISLKKKSTTIKIMDLSIQSMMEGSGHAISIIQPNGGNQHRRNVILRDIEISNFRNKKEYFFIKAINLQGVWRPMIDNVFVSGFYGPKAKGKIPKMLSCFQLDDVYSPTIINSRCWSSQFGINMTSKHNPGPEGLIVDQSKFVETVIGINIDYISQEPGGFITNNHINAMEKGINIKNRKFLIIKNNLMYRNEYSKSYIDMNFINVNDSIISENIFHHPSKKRPLDRKEINLKNSKNNTIINNFFTKPSKKIFGEKKNNKIENNFISGSK